MPGKRDLDDAIRHFIESVERSGTVPDYYESKELVIENGSSIWIDGEEVDADISDFDVTVGNDLDLSDSVERATRQAERDAFDKLVSNAATTIRVVDRPLTIDDFRDVIHAMRNEGYGSDVLYAPGSPSEVTRKSKGAAFFVGESVADDLEASTGDRNAHLDSIPVLESSGAPPNVGVLVDVEGLAPTPPVHAPNVPFLVVDRRAIVAIEKVDTDFEWVGDA